MRITVKLFALLSRYLPAGAKENAAEIDVADGATVQTVIRSLSLPDEYCHLVLVNGVFLPPSERERRKLAPGDAVAVWPPVAGGARS